MNEVFKDNYVLEFLGLPEAHSESDLKNALIANMKAFVLELGSDFIFVGQEKRIQVGNQDFYIDLLFFHRGLAALVAFELKIGRFMPEHLGQLSFYLEALDRDIKKAARKPEYRRAALPRQRRGGSGICPFAPPFTFVGGAIQLATARQETATSQTT